MDDGYGKSLEETEPSFNLDEWMKELLPDDEVDATEFGGDDEGKDLWLKAKSIFSLSLRNCSQPISLKEMVKTWDASARKVFQEFAEQRGGGSFSSRYGKWENDIASFLVS